MIAKVFFRSLLCLGPPLVIALCGLTPPAGAQQGGRVILLGPDLGRVIDSAERSALGLFPDVEGFVTAMFYQLSDSSFAARVAYREDGRQTITWRHDIPEEWLERLRECAGGGEVPALHEETEHVDATDHAPAEPAELVMERPPKIRTRQLLAPGVVLGYYWPSLKTLGESLGADLEPGRGYGARVAVWVIPRGVLVADYFEWRSKISGVTELYRVDTRLTVQAVMLTVQYKPAGILSAGAGLGVYFCEYRCDYGREHRRRNEGVGAHVSLGFLGGPHWETVNLSLEARYVFATVGETSKGFPKTELSGPVVMASVLF